jgi:hypothetical protein
MSRKMTIVSVSGAAGRKSRGVEPQVVAPVRVPVVAVVIAGPDTHVDPQRRPSAPSASRTGSAVPPSSQSFVAPYHRDFVPDNEPYEHLTIVELTPADDGVRVVMTVGPLHDQVWTDRLLAGRANELDNLATVVAHRNAA